MGLALLFVIWLITLVSSYYFAVKKWWMPELASAQGAAIDQQFTLSYILMGAVFLLAQLALGYFAWRYRDRAGAKAQYTHGHNRLEATWVALTAVLFIGLNLMGLETWAENRFQHEPPPDATVVEITGVQFQWYFRYPGPDGKFGRLDAKLRDPSLGSAGALGLDDTDPAAADDIVVNTLFVPVNRQVNLKLRANDVIHNFFIPAMRFKQDAVPGMVIDMHFTPIRTGEFEVACAELCGLGHYRMRASLHVVEEAEFKKWVDERLAEKEF